MRGIPNPLTSAEELSDRLAAETANRKGVAVAVFQDGDCLYASSDGGEGFSCDTPGVVGCIAKCLTAAVVMDAVASSLLGTQDRIADVLRLRSKDVRAGLQGITVEHLLNHSHGLDDSAIDSEAIPKCANRCLDVDQLCLEATAVPRIALPGETYSYGGIGSWLAAGLLEQVHGTTFSEILRHRLFEPMGINAAADESIRDVCPAWGGPFSMSAADLLRFLHPHLSNGRGGMWPGLDLMRTGRIPMPGWGPWQKSATSGWNFYGDGWLGHNGNRDQTGIALRFHRSEPLAIAVTANREADCFFVLARLFGDVLEEFTSDYVRMPKALDPEAWSAVGRARLLGTYESAKWRVHVQESPRAGFLRMSVFDRARASSGSVLNRYLRAQENDVYFTVPAGIDYPFVQFIGEVPSKEHAAYLWNGRELWRFVE